MQNRKSQSEDCDKQVGIALRRLETGMLDIILSVRLQYTTNKMGALATHFQVARPIARKTARAAGNYLNPAVLPVIPVYANAMKKACCFN